MQEKIHKYLGKVNMIIKFKHWFSLLKKGNLKVIYYFAHQIYDWIRGLEYLLIYLLCRPIPLKNKVVASAFNGKKYGDNTKYIVEKIHELNPNIEIVWLRDPELIYDTPNYVRCIACSSDKYIFRRIYEYATAKVWLDTHLLDKYLIKRKGQLVINTWHGGLGIKKIEGDVQKFANNIFQLKKINITANKVDIFISNSSFLSSLYRRAFFYKGKVWKCGFPKNDLFVKDTNIYKEKVLTWFNLKKETKLLVYAPTYRGSFEDSGKLDLSPYSVDFHGVLDALKENWGGKWVVLVRWHPSMSKIIKNLSQFYSDTVIDASSYEEMQEIIAASDAFISDYSSCLFDAAVKRIPCLIFATDFDEYQKDRGTYFKMEELPFPYASTNKDLIHNICTYNSKEYLKRWDLFIRDMGLKETGKSAESIAKMICNYISGDGKIIRKIITSRE